MGATLGHAFQVLDLPSILMALHTYFTSLGYDEIRRLGAANDKALRMAKTLLHELCKHAVSSLSCAVTGWHAMRFAFCLYSHPCCSVISHFRQAEM